MSKTALSALDRFMQSMKIGYMEWHEGIPYDLDALVELSETDLLAVESHLIERNAADWRDVQALDRIGSPRAIEALRKASSHEELDIRMEAARLLAERNALTPQEIESLIVTALGETSILNGMVKTLAFARAHVTPAVIQKLLWCTVDGHEDIHVHAAALLHFLHGKASSPFDMKHRPFYLQFGSKVRSERLGARERLCAKIGISV